MLAAQQSELAAEFEKQMAAHRAELEKRQAELSDEILLRAVQRSAVSHAREQMAIALTLPDPSWRGKVIGKEGRTVQALQAATGADFSLDDESPAIWSIARQVIGAALVLALAYFVLRPMMQVLTRPQPIAAAAASVEYAAQMQPMFAPGGRMMGLPMGYDDRMAAARSVAGQDPRQVAQVVRNWVAEDNG